MRPGKRLFPKFLRKYLVLKNKAKAAMQNGDVNLYIEHLLEAHETKKVVKRMVVAR